MNILLKIAAIFFDIIFVVIMVYVFMVFGIRIIWWFKAKRLRGKEVPFLKNQFVRFKRGKGLIYFHSPNCGPCKLIDPIFKKLSKELKDIHFARIDVSKDPNISKAFGVLATPCMVITQDGRIKEVLIGAITERTLRRKLH